MRNYIFGYVQGAFTKNIAITREMMEDELPWIRAMDKLLKTNYVEAIEKRLNEMDNEDKKQRTGN